MKPRMNTLDSLIANIAFKIVLANIYANCSSVEKNGISEEITYLQSLLWNFERRKYHQSLLTRTALHTGELCQSGWKSNGLLSLLHFW